MQVLTKTRMIHICSLHMDGSPEKSFSVNFSWRTLRDVCAHVLHVTVYMQHNEVRACHAMPCVHSLSMSLRRKAKKVLRNDVVQLASYSSISMLNRSQAMQTDMVVTSEAIGLSSKRQIAASERSSAKCSAFVRARAHTHTNSGESRISCDCKRIQ